MTATSAATKNKPAPIAVRTPLYDMHVAAAARMVEFAGYEMPVQYEGVKAEHIHTRTAAGLFDVSHMGQLIVRGRDAAAALEKLMPADIGSLAVGQLCYTQLTLGDGGILDDLIVARRASDEFLLVVNAGCKQADIEHLKQYLDTFDFEHLEDQALLALQGPCALSALSEVFPALATTIAELVFMQGVDIEIEDTGCFISRSGYTGEDGVEISLPASIAATVAEKLLAHQAVQWIGLGARDSLRLEAGLCLYGHEIDASTTPVEAGLRWSISPSRRSGGEKQGGFIGDDAILSQLECGVSRVRSGFMVDGRAPVREGAELVSEQGDALGKITSGGFSPTLQRPIAMGYIDKQFLASGEKCFAMLRGKLQPLSICKLPFVAHQYHRS
jgi:aminomethyltransferase